MSTPVIAFFNNKGGVGKTSLVYHVSWMLADLGYRVLAVDLDPQGNLSAAFLDEDGLAEIWQTPADDSPSTIYDAVVPLREGTGDVSWPGLVSIDERLALLVGDVRLSRFEDDLSEEWHKCARDNPRAYRVISSLSRIIQHGATSHQADVVLADLGPNLGAINRAALISADFVVIPLGPDLFSLQGLQNLGPTMRSWRNGWKERLEKNPLHDVELPQGNMQPLGYVVMQHAMRRDRPVKAYDKWIARIPRTYHDAVGTTPEEEAPVGVANDKNCIAMMKHYRSLMPLAQDARKPMFHLKVADGALGAHVAAVRDAYNDFRQLATEIVKRAGIQPNTDLKT